MAERADDLVKLLFLHSVLSKRSEKERAKKCVATTTGEHFKMIYEVANRVHLPKNSEFKECKIQMLQECLSTANYWLDKSNKPINKNTNMSYCDLWEQAELITSSSYMESQGCEPNYEDCKIGIFWDLHSCPLPNQNNYSDFRAKINDVLKEMGFCGESEFFAVGDIDGLDPAVKRFLTSQVITTVKAEQERVGAGTKDTTEKQIIVTMMRWVYRYLSQNKEGGVVVVVTGDKGIRFAIEEMKEQNFRVVVVHNQKPQGKEDCLLGEYAYKVIYLHNLLQGRME